MRITALLFMLALGSTLLTGCGQKGPLTLPEENPAPAAPG